VVSLPSLNNLMVLIFCRHFLSWIYLKDRIEGLNNTLHRHTGTSKDSEKKKELMEKNSRIERFLT